MQQLLQGIFGWFWRIIAFPRRNATVAAHEGPTKNNFHALAQLKEKSRLPSNLLRKIDLMAGFLFQGVGTTAGKNRYSP